MPWAPKRPCPVSGCPQLLDRGQSRCARHLAAEQRAVDQRRGSAASRGYGHTWRKLRLLVLRRDPVCTIGKICGGTAPSTEVDHIVPKRAGGEDREDNLQGACKACHSWKTATEDGRWGRA